MITLERLESILAGFPRLTIGLVGDLFLDRYLEIDPGVHEISVETGLEAYQVRGVRNSPGALGTIMNNLTALGVGRMLPVSVVGDDGHAFDLLTELSLLPVDPRGIFKDPKRLTPTYTKPMKRDSAGVWQELNRLDVKTRGPLFEQTEQRLLKEVERVFHETDGLIVLDQVSEPGWGVVDPGLRNRLGELSRGQPKKLIFIDSRAHIGHFSCGVLKPNLAECLRATGQESISSETVARAAAVQLSQKTGRPLYCTLGERGMLVVRPSGEIIHAPSIAVSGPIDTVGAGDSATSGIVAALLSGASDLEAAAVGNLVASITVQQLGTTGTATPPQVVARWHEAR